ncbi:hypothetical protein JB92DRAFT_2972307 [Gautieria morchelliformis]|nr:hypothetical protein JB92DRAFT_2972307 [Gautieria morchelliformis]
MGSQWTNEYGEMSNMEGRGQTYSGVIEQPEMPQTSYSYDEGMAATAEPYARMYSQSGPTVTVDNLRNSQASTSTAWTHRESSSSEGIITYSENEASPSQADSDISGSENAATQHEWIQTGAVTTTRLLSHLVREASHAGVRYFFCGVEGCSHSGFPHKSQLITHIRSVHLQEKPFLCITCSTPFARKQEAIRHVNSANNGRRYECNICGKTFFRHSRPKRNHLARQDAGPTGRGMTRRG